MTRFLLVGVLAIAAMKSASAENIGVCPPAPTLTKAPTQQTELGKEEAPNPEAKFAGTVILQAVISDKGHVCSLGVVQAFDRTAAKMAIDSVSKWKFDPAKKGGHPVPVVATVQIHFWRMPDGSFVQSAKPMDSKKPEQQPSNP